MLILTRRVGESIVIGDDIVVTVVEAGRDHIRIGISAPRDVAVHRQEVYAEIQRENEAARDLVALPKAADGSVTSSALPRRPPRS